MNFANFSSHAVPYFVSSKVLPKNLLYYKLTSLLMLDVHNNSVPSTLSDMFTRTHCMHNYNKRSSSAGNYYINYSRTNQYKKFLYANRSENLEYYSRKIEQSPETFV